MDKGVQLGGFPVLTCSNRLRAKLRTNPNRVILGHAKLGEQPLQRVRPMLFLDIGPKLKSRVAMGKMELLDFEGKPPCPKTENRVPLGV